MSIELETFLGDWKDSFGNDVEVDWSKPGSRGGQLSVVLTNPRSSRPPIRLDVKSTGGRFTCGHYDLDFEKSNEDSIVWLDTRRSGKSSVWRRDGVGSRRSRSRSRSYERKRLDSARVSGRRGSRSGSRGRGRSRQDPEAAPGNWGASRYGLPSPAVYWAQAAPGWVPPEVPRSAVASEGPTPGAWVPPSMEKRESSESVPNIPLALPAPEEPAGVEEDILGAPLMPIARAAPVKVLPPPPLVDEMEEFDKLLLQLEGGSNGGSSGTQRMAKERTDASKKRDKMDKPPTNIEQQKVEEEKARAEKEQRDKEMRDKEQKKAQREKDEREKRQQELEAKKQPKQTVKPKTLAAQSSLAVKLELVEDLDKDDAKPPAAASAGAAHVTAVAQPDTARDPRRRPSPSDLRQESHEDEEATLKVLVDPYLAPQDSALSVEVLSQPKAVPKPVPKRRRLVAPKKAIAKYPPAPTTPMTPMTPVISQSEQEKKLLEIKQLLQKETQSLESSPMAPPPPPAPPPVGAPPASPAVPMAPMTPRTPNATPEDEAQERRLMAYSMLLLGGEEDAEEQAPWKKQKRRRAVGVEL